MSEARTTLVLVASLVVALAAACRSTSDDTRADAPVGTSTKPDVKAEARAGVCPPSSVAQLFPPPPG